MNGFLYDLATAPLERLALAGLRRRLWREVPHGGLGLEVGAGTGTNFARHPAGARIVAIDASPSMLRRACRKPCSAGVLRVVCDVQALPFRDGTFDWGAETLVFCEVSDPVAGLREIARVLRPGAPWAMLEHVRPPGWLGAGAALLSRLTAPLFGEYFDRIPDPALDDAGFAVRRRESFGRGIFRILLCNAPL